MTRVWRLWGGACLFLFAGNALASFVVSDMNHVSAEDLANEIAGDGVTVSNVTYSGADGAAGIFSGGETIVGIPSGVILSSGTAGHIAGPNHDDEHSTSHENPGDAELAAVAGAEFTADAAVLEFDFVPAGDNLSMSFVFGSDEYPLGFGQEQDDVQEGPPDTRFNDVFAVFVNGVNCALIPETTDPVTINTVNEFANAGFYVDNQDGSHNTEMDGFTLVLDCPAGVMPGVTNHLKLGIADAGHGTDPETEQAIPDDSVDSWALIQMGSLTSEPEEPEPPEEPECNEDGLLLVQTTGAASALVHNSVEPLLGGVHPNLANFTHKVNCWLVVPVEDGVDPITDNLSKRLGDLTGL